MEKVSASLWAKALEYLTRPIGRAAGRSAGKLISPVARSAYARMASEAAREVAVAPKAVHTLPVERQVERTTEKLLDMFGLGAAKGKSGRVVRDALRGSDRNVRSAISKAIDKDIGAFSAELDRLSALRSAATDEATLNAIQKRIEYIGARHRRLVQRARYFKQTPWDRLTRNAGLAMELGFGGMEAYEAQKNFREGNYANAAYHAAMAPIFGLGRAAGTLGRGIRYGSKSKGARSFGKMVEAAGKPFENMEFAGKYGKSGNKLTRWMLRHPILSAEAIGTPFGADTMLNSFTKDNGVDAEPVKNGGGLTYAGANPSAGVSYRGTTISAADARRMQSMSDSDLLRWLKDKGIAR